MMVTILSSVAFLCFVPDGRFVCSIFSAGAGKMFSTSVAETAIFDDYMIGFR